MSSAALSSAARGRGARQPGDRGHLTNEIETPDPN